jgi:hypothetical protein
MEKCLTPTEYSGLALIAEFPDLSPTQMQGIRDSLVSPLAGEAADLLKANQDGEELRKSASNKVAYSLVSSLLIRARRNRQMVHNLTAKQMSRHPKY